MLGKRLGDQERQHERGVGAHLDLFGIRANLAPRNGLVRGGARVGAVKLVGGVDVDGKVCTVAHEVGVGDVVLDEAAADDEHARGRGGDAETVDAADVLHNVEDETRVLVRVEEEHVADGAVGERRAEDRDVVAGGPVQHGGLVVDALAEQLDERARRPHDGAALLLLERVVQQRHDPILEFAVVLIGHEQVADAVQTALAQVGAVEAEGTDAGGTQTLDEILLDAARGGDDDVDAAVAYQEVERLAQAGGDHVGGVAEEDAALCVARHAGAQLLRGGLPADLGRTGEGRGGGGSARGGEGRDAGEGDAGVPFG